MRLQQKISDAAEVLLLPFATGELGWPGAGALFLRAQHSSALSAFAAQGLLCEQTDKVLADALQQAGYTLISTEQIAEQGFPLLMFLPTRCREESRALLARAFQQVLPGGHVLACQANNEGARSGEADMARLAGNVQSLSRSKCRVFWAKKTAATADAALLEEWLALDAPRPIEEGRFLSRPGLFAWSRIDAASALLASCLPENLAGKGADLGAGFGFLAAEVARRCPQVTAIDLYEVEARALALARQNLGPCAGRTGFDYLWHDVTTGLLPGRRYDFIVSNPPFHRGHADEPGIGRAFLEVAAGSLREGGRFWLVANRHLPYEDVLRRRFRSVREVCSAQGFKVIEAIR